MRSVLFGACVALTTAAVADAQPAAGLPGFVVEQKGARTLRFPAGSSSYAERVFATMSERGDVFVAVPDDATIYVFNASGGLQYRIGRRGAGPGEFRAITSIALIRGDTLLVHDASLRRVSAFAPGGKFVSSDEAPALLRCCARDGRHLVGSYRPSPPDGPDPGIAEFRLAQWTAAGDTRTRSTAAEPLLTAGTRPPALVLNRQSGANGGFSFGPVVTLPLFPVAQLAMSADVVATSDGAGAVLRLHDLATASWRSVALPVSVQPLTKATVQAATESLLAERTDKANEMEIRKALGAVEWPRTRPTVDRLLPDAANGFWVRESNADAASAQRWMLVSFAGTVTKRLSVPVETDVLAIHGEAVLVRAASPDGDDRVYMATRLRASK